MQNDEITLQNDAPNWNDVAIWGWGAIGFLGAAILWLLKVLSSMIINDYKQDKDKIFARLDAMEKRQDELEKGLNKILTKIEHMHNNIKHQNNSFKTVPDGIFERMEEQHQELLNIIHKDLDQIKKNIK